MEPVPVPIDLQGAGLMAIVLAALVTPVIAHAVLWRYRRAVHRSMLRPAAGHGTPAAPSPAGTPAVPPPAGVPAAPSPAAAGAPRLEWQVLDRDSLIPDTDPAAEGLVRRARSAAHRSVLVHGVAAAVYGVAAAVVLLGGYGVEFYPRRFATLAVVAAWPLLPTLVSVLGANRRTQLMLSGGYVLVLLGLAVPAGASVREVLGLAAITVLPPAMLLVATTHPRHRAVGPLLVPGAFAGCLAFVVLPWLAWPLVAAGLSVYTSLALLAVAGVAVAAAVTLLYLRWLGRRYERKRSSDRSLLIAQWWLLAALWLGVSLVPSGARWIPLALLPFLAHHVVVRAGTRLLRPGTTAADNVRLLLLRTFGARRRSERLLGAIGRSWRYLGSVQLIAGTDLAAANLEPHEFLEFVRGKLARRFIGGEADLERRLANRDPAPDPDGRYRVDEFFCHDDTWRPTVHRLARDSDAVLMDLRGFTSTNLGVRYELASLVELVWLEHVVLAVDDSTDAQLVRATITQAWVDMPPWSPNRGVPITTLRVLRLDAGRGATGPAVLGALCSAARPVTGAPAGAPPAEGVGRTSGVPTQGA